MLEKIREIGDRYDTLERRLSRLEVIRDRMVYQRYLKEHKVLTPIIDSFREYKSVQREIEDNRSLLNDADPEMRKIGRAHV